MCWLEKISAPGRFREAQKQEKCGRKKTNKKMSWSTWTSKWYWLMHRSSQKCFCTRKLMAENKENPKGERVVKYLIGDNLIHLLVSETRSPERRRWERRFCRLLFVSLRVIPLPRGRLSVERLHENIPSDPGHYGPIQQQPSLLPPVSPWLNLLGPQRCC